MATETTDRPPFWHYLKALERGGLDLELGDNFKELIEAIVQTGKGGSLTLKLDVKPAEGGDVDAVTITSKITTKKPDPKRQATIFFVDEQHRLTRTDPRQGDFADVVPMGRTEH